MRTVKQNFLLLKGGLVFLFGCFFGGRDGEKIKYLYFFPTIFSLEYLLRVTEDRFKMEKENLHPSSPAIPPDRAQNVKTSLRAQLLQTAPDSHFMQRRQLSLFPQQLMEIMLLQR